MRAKIDGMNIDGSGVPLGTIVSTTSVMTLNTCPQAGFWQAHWLSRVSLDAALEVRITVVCLQWGQVILIPRVPDSIRSRRSWYTGLPIEGDATWSMPSQRSSFWIVFIFPTSCRVPIGLLLRVNQPTAAPRTALGCKTDELQSNSFRERAFIHARCGVDVENEGGAGAAAGSHLAGCRKGRPGIDSR